MEILPGTDGLLHISQIGPGRVNQVTDVLKEGEEIMVKVLEVDKQGKIRLSRKEAMEQQASKPRSQLETRSELPMQNERPMVTRSQLDNGLRVVTETMPGVPSVTVGIWVENGSRYERSEQAGISHFLEHLFFKGTERRTAAQIAEEFDAVGGVLNAFTGKEYTCYYGKVLAEHLPLAQDILGDIFLHSLLRSRRRSSASAPWCCKRSCRWRTRRTTTCTTSSTCSSGPAIR